MKNEEYEISLLIHSLFLFVQTLSFTLFLFVK